MASGEAGEVVHLGRSRVLFVMALGQEYGPHLAARFRPLLTGVGPIEAAAVTAARLAELRGAGTLPDLVVSIGSSGSRRVPLGAVRQVASVSWRDIDATRLGFAKGITPFLDLPAVVQLPTPIPDLPTATLSTGADIVGGERYEAIDADLVDMETYAVLRACQHAGVPMIGLRGVSDGPGELDSLGGWTALLHLLDERLAAAVDQLASALSSQAPGADAA